MVNPQDSFDYTPALIQYVLSNPLVGCGAGGDAQCRGGGAQRGYRRGHGRADRSEQAAHKVCLIGEGGVMPDGKRPVDYVDPAHGYRQPQGAVGSLPRRPAAPLAWSGSARTRTQSARGSPAIATPASVSTALATFTLFSSLACPSCPPLALCAVRPGRASMPPASATPTRSSSQAITASIWPTMVSGPSWPLPVASASIATPFPPPARRISSSTWAQSWGQRRSRMSGRGGWGKPRSRAMWRMPRRAAAPSPCRIHFVVRFDTPFAALGRMEGRGCLARDGRGLWAGLGRLCQLSHRTRAGDPDQGRASLM